MKWLPLVALLSASSMLAAQTVDDPWPRTVDAFRAAVQKVLDDTRVPGTGIALVRQSGVEWAGGIGLADRDRRTPVTADTHFRAGSISKTLVAMALVQLSEDGEVDLDAPVAELAPDVRIDNPWEASDPVRVIHLLQHTAGLDDMHFNELYNVAHPPDMPLLDVLRINPRSRVVRWRPGTRVSYSNPGYAIAGHLIEKISGQPFEDFIAARTFEPIGMTTSSFRLTPADEALLAQGYRAATGAPVGYSQIYLRPAGNLHTSAAELGKFVHVLLNWGETADRLVIDPEYLSNMEHPHTSLASDAGLRNGYGSAIAASFTEGFPMLGHSGGIDGFSSLYAYSTSRDAGYVVMLNSTHSGEAMQRISRLAIRYLKADVEPPAKPEATLDAAVLERYRGYYHGANPRLGALAFIEWLLGGQTISVEGRRLVASPVFGRTTPLLPVSETLFRLEDEPEATRVFATDADGTMVFAGGFPYLERRSRWLVEIVRWPVLLSFALVLTPLILGVVWIVHALVTRRAEFVWLKALLLLCALGIALPFMGVMNVNDLTLGTRNIWTGSMFLGTLVLPVAAILALALTVDAWRRGARAWLRAYAVAVSSAAIILTAYLTFWGMLAFRPWAS